MSMSADHQAEPQNPDRHLLAAYLHYALDELALVNETSALLVKLAIASLTEETSVVPSDQGENIDFE